MIRRRVSLALELLVAVMTPAAWCLMVFRGNHGGALSTTGLVSLRYFTVLSNLLAGAASLCCLCLRRRPGWLIRLRLTAAAAVALTFLTVLLMLGPLYGFLSMYRGANLWFHLILPLASCVGFVLLDGPRPLPRSAAWPAVLPMLLYGLGYCGNILAHGKGQGPATNDWYGFLNWGWAIGAVIFAALGLVTWLSAQLLRAEYNRHPRR